MRGTFQKKITQIEEKSLDIFPVNDTTLLAISTFQKMRKLWPLQPLQSILSLIPSNKLFI